MSQYTDNLLGQPAAVLSLLDHLDFGALAAFGARAGEFDRLILTGMGASLGGAYPAWELLAGAGRPAWLVDTGELLGPARALITPRSLVWIVSQSGKGREGTALLEALAAQPPALILGTTNHPDSPLGQRAGVVLPLLTHEEHGVATRSYVNTLAVTQLAALAMTGQALAPAVAQLRRGAEQLAAYLQDWEQRVAAWAPLVPAPDRFILVGRGASLAAAQTGALVFKEAARVNAEGVSAGAFRHGPLELSDERLTVIFFENPGGPAEQDADHQLARLTAQCGARVIWLGAHGPADLPGFPTPAAEGVARPMAQIVPLQLLSLHLARAGGFEAAAFRHLHHI